MQDALRRQQAVLARRIAAGRGDGRARRRLARKERMAQRTAAERAAHDERRRLRQVSPSFDRTFCSHLGVINCMSPIVRVGTQHHIHIAESVHVRCSLWTPYSPQCGNIVCCIMFIYGAASNVSAIA